MEQNQKIKAKDNPRDNLIVGIDEAGRGSIIGPMVIALVVMSKNNIKLLGSKGVKDSKLLTKKRRESLFKEIIKTAYKVNYKVIKPRIIDHAIKNKVTNLNILELNSMVELMANLDCLENVTKVYIDCPSSNVSKFKQKFKYELYKRLKKNLSKINIKKIDLIIEHKADSKYRIVGAASIIAKVIRDNEINKLKNQFNHDFGSGYPSDPLTKEFLNKNYRKKELDEHIRKSWATYQNLKKLEEQTKKQKKISDF